jgi:hypothetical protein
MAKTEHARTQQCKLRTKAERILPTPVRVHVGRACQCLRMRLRFLLTTLACAPWTVRSLQQRTVPLRPSEPLRHRCVRNPKLVRISPQCRVNHCSVPPLIASLVQAAGKLREAATYYHAILRRQPNHSVANNLAQLIWMCVNINVAVVDAILRCTVPHGVHSQPVAALVLLASKYAHRVTAHRIGAPV